MQVLIFLQHTTVCRVPQRSGREASIGARSCSRVGKGSVYLALPAGRRRRGQPADAPGWALAAAGEVQGGLAGDPQDSQVAVGPAGGPQPPADPGYVHVATSTLLGCREGGGRGALGPQTHPPLPGPVLDMLRDSWDEGMALLAAAGQLDPA